MLFGCSWYEGAVTAGYSSDEVDDAVQASIVAAGYSSDEGYRFYDV